MTKRGSTGMISSGLLAVLTGIAVLVGCEGDKPDTSAADGFFSDNPFNATGRSAPTMRINPVVANAVTVGQIIDFAVLGGEGPYQWRIASKVGGHLRIVDDKQAKYDVKALLDNSVIVRDRNNAVAVAYVQGEQGLSILPTTASIEKDGGTVQFRAKGGQPPYTFELALPQIGEITGSGLYTRKGVGEQVVYLFDRSGNAAAASVNQPETTLTLTVTPASATLGTNDLFAVFAVKGGSPPYFWTTGVGSVSAPVGSSTVYNRPHAMYVGSDFVTVTDSSVPAALTVSAIVTMNLD
jgi:hypothetical protein